MFLVLGDAAAQTAVREVDSQCEVDCVVSCGTDHCDHKFGTLGSFPTYTESSKAFEVEDCEFVPVHHQRKSLREVTR